MKKYLIVTVLSIAFIIMLMAYLIDRETSNAMESLFKNDDIEILDSLRLDKTNAVYIYENSQIINGPHAKFIVFANSLSCDIKNKEALLVLLWHFRKSMKINEKDYLSR